jgi:hypothetical protein
VSIAIDRAHTDTETQLPPEGTPASRRLPEVDEAGPDSSRSCSETWPTSTARPRLMLTTAREPGAQFRVVKVVSSGMVAIDGSHVPAGAPFVDLDDKMAVVVSPAGSTNLALGASFPSPQARPEERRRSVASRRPLIGLVYATPRLRTRASKFAPARRCRFQAKKTRKLQKKASSPRLDSPY